jgi:hypothetical protein
MAAALPAPRRNVWKTIALAALVLVAIFVVAVLVGLFGGTVIGGVMSLASFVTANFQLAGVFLLGFAACWILLTVISNDLTKKLTDQARIGIAFVILGLGVILIFTGPGLLQAVWISIGAFFANFTWGMALALVVGVVLLVGGWWLHRKLNP